MKTEGGKHRYQVIYEEIRGAIESGRYTAGERLPLDGEIAQTYGVSMITVKKAMTLLKEEGFVDRVPGVGSFVSEAQVPEENAETAADASGPARAGERCIGLILEHVSDAFGLELMYVIDREAQRRGWKILTRFSYYNTEQEAEEIRYLIQTGVQGIIIMPCHGLYYSAGLLQQIIGQFPVVIIDKRIEGLPVTSVRTDNAGAIETLAELLVKRKKQSIAFLSYRLHGTSSLKEREHGFHRAAARMSFKALEWLIDDERDPFRSTPNDHEISQLEELLQKEALPDAVICAEFRLIPILQQACKNLGIDIGRENIVCMDGISNSGYTHIHQDESRIAAEAVKLLIEAVERRSSNNSVMPDVRDVLIPGILTPVESV